MGISFQAEGAALVASRRHGCHPWTEGGG